MRPDFLYFDQKYICTIVASSLFPYQSTKESELRDDEQITRLVRSMTSKKYIHNYFLAYIIPKPSIATQERCDARC